jgi:RNA polymerase sigma-70 factor (ECF subfamily)
LRYSSISGDELVRACAELNDDAAWREFVSRFHRPISLSVFRTAYQWNELPQQVLDDLVQETYLKLCADKCRLLHEFALQHPDAIVGYIKTIAANVVHDHFRSFRSQKRGEGKAHDSLEDVDPKAAGSSPGNENATERQILLQQVDRCLTTCSKGPDQERDRMVFWLYYQQGMSAKEIATLPTVGLTAKGVESIIFRLTRLVREQIINIRDEPSAKSNSNEKGFRPAESY